MKTRREILIVLISTVLLTGLFHRQYLGLNLLFFETLFIIWLFLSKKHLFTNLYLKTISIGLITTLLATIFTHSVFSYIIHFLVLFILVGLLIYPDCKSLINTFLISFTNIFRSQIQFLNKISSSKFKGHRIGSYIWKTRIFIIPIFIIFLFIILYSASNPIFDSFISNVFMLLQKFWYSIFKNFDFVLILTVAISLFLSNYLFLRTANHRIIQVDIHSNDKLSRLEKKNPRRFKLNALRNELKAGVFLLLILNFILLILNIIDINWVWFNFEWEGQYLKQFVHEGTYLLILSILVSIVLVLYFFRANLNFYRKNNLLRLLSYIWLAQNGILTISVAIRNFWYIYYFALAYKRIGVLLFLILTIYGLFTVLIKVKKQKSTFYLFRSNAYAILVVLIISSITNWDNIIAKYNFKQSEKSFLHLDYMVTLSDKSLPYLDKSLGELQRIGQIQKVQFPFEQEFMTSEEYYRRIQERKQIFNDKWESKCLLSWNLPEYLAYKKLNKK